MSIAGDRFPTELDPINQQSGIHQEFAILSTVQPFRTVKDYRDYLARLAAFPKAVDQTIALMERGRQSGWIVPAVPIRDVPAAMKEQVAETPEKSVHWKPFEKFPDTVPEAERERSARGGPQTRSPATSYRPTAVSTTISSSTYLPAARKDVGAWALPNGAEFYAHEVKRYTTTNLTPGRDPRDRPVRGRADPRRDGGDHPPGRFQGSFDDFPASCGPIRASTTRRPRSCSPAIATSASGSTRSCRRLFWTLPRLPYGVHADARLRGADHHDGLLPPGSRRSRLAPRLLLRQHVPAGDAAEVRDGGAHAARGRAGPPPADRARAGARGRAEVPPAWRLHGVRRGLGPLLREPRRRDGLLQGPLLASSASSPTRCGAPCGSSWTRACTRMGGRASRRSTS